MHVLSRERIFYQLQGYEHVEALSLLVRKDRGEKTFRRVYVAPTQTRAGNQARKVHGVATVRSVIREE